MSQREQVQTITISRVRCPKCNAPVKQSGHWADVRYFQCACGNRFRGVVK